MKDRFHFTSVSMYDGGDLTNTADGSIIDSSDEQILILVEKEANVFSIFAANAQMKEHSECFFSHHSSITDNHVCVLNQSKRKAVR